MRLGDWMRATKRLLTRKERRGMRMGVRKRRGITKIERKRRDVSIETSEQVGPEPRHTGAWDSQPDAHPHECKRMH